MNEMQPIEIEGLKTVGVDDDRKVETHKITFDGFPTPHENAPPVRPYRFNIDQLRDVQVSLKLGINVLITGPTGCGKTSLPIALAALLGIPVIRFNCNGETRVAGLVGMQKPAAENGVLTLKFSHGALVRAFQEGYWIVFDEIDAAPPGVLMVLQPVLEEGNPSLHIPETDEHIRPHPRCHIFATGNTLGYRSKRRAHHAGTNVMNTAFLDRFGIVIAAEYPDRFEEVERIVVNVPSADRELVDGLCRVAEKLRGDSGFRSDFSTRRLIQWARLLEYYEEDELKTFELAVARKLTSASDVKVARETLRRVFGYDGQS